MKQIPNFANLNQFLELSQGNQWDTLDFAVKTFQNMTQRIRFSKGPVVAAPFQLTLGGGTEIIQPAAHRVASAETYMGFVEMGVGLIPGGGGNLRMILNAIDKNKGAMGAFQKIQKAFETIGFAKVATGAYEAKDLGLLKQDDVLASADGFFIHVYVDRKTNKPIILNYEFKKKLDTIYVDLKN